MTDKAYPETNSYTMYDDAPQTTARRYGAITPSDATVLEPAARALRVGGFGDVVVADIDGNEHTFTNVQDAETLPIWVTKVLATGTTATNITGYFG